jgi:high-affinity Fe2+/Pb2+ permease
MKDSGNIYKRKDRSMIKISLGLVIGGLIGFAFYWFIGCSTGACPITSNPWISTIFGMVVGAMLSNSFRA